MLASLALVALLQLPGVGADGLTISQPRLTHGLLGPVRTQAVIRPGDGVHLAFDVEGINADETGKASYSTTVNVADGSGKTLFAQPAKKYQEFLSLGGNSLPAFAAIDLGLDTPAGNYSMTVTVTDSISGKSAKITQPFKVEPKAFDLVRLSTSGDADGLVPVGALVVGQPFWVHAAVVEFQRGGDASKQPRVDVMLRILGADKKPVGQPFTGSIEKDVPPNATSLPIRFFVPLNKAGNYTVELKAKDEHSKNAPAAVSFPITVLSPK